MAPPPLKKMYDIDAPSQSPVADPQLRQWRSGGWGGVVRGVVAPKQADQLIDEEDRKRRCYSTCARKITPVVYPGLIWSLATQPQQMKNIVTTFFFSALLPFSVIVNSNCPSEKPLNSRVETLKDFSTVS